MPASFTIIGGGIAGLTTAIALQRAGIESTIFEAAPEIKAIGAGLALSANALKAFNRLEMVKAVTEQGRLLDLFTVYDEKGKPITRVDSRVLGEKYGIGNLTIHRAALHALLHSEIDPSGIHLNKRLTSLDQKADHVVLSFDDGSTHTTNFLIAADGVHSAVRSSLLPGALPRYAGYTCWRAVIDNSGLQLSETSETWGQKGRFGITPLAGNKIYWYACINGPQNDPRFRLYKVVDLLKHFGRFHAPIPVILQQTKDEDLIWNDIIDLKPLPHFAYGNIVLTGDAAHATTPNMGQGGCQAIEDAVVLADELRGMADVPAAFRRFEQRRLKRTHAIVNTSRIVGKVAQWENKWLMGVRDFMFRQLPRSINEKQMKSLFEVDFE
jgi:2-polyprenyl-6-methoxyphenol hydroxylase-like FAD-dependent oxidoreductase